MSKRIFRPGNRWLVAFLAFLGAFSPLSTDMYLPALPSMAQAMHTSYNLVSLTVSGFILFFSLSMLAWGPLSDKYGRRPVLLTGSLLYILSSAGIAVTDSIVTLIALRAVQATASGALAAMSLAVVKDTMRGERLERMVTLLQTFTIIAPMVAPVAGGALLAFANWRIIFCVLTLCGGFALAGSLALRETCPRRTEGSVVTALGRLFVVLGNSNFLRPLLLFSMLAMPFFAYLGVSSLVYQEIFGVSPQEYSAFFAANASVSLFGPILHLRVFRFLPRTRVLFAHMSVMLVCGALLLLFGGQGKWFFFAAYAAITFCGSALRAPTTVIMMESIRGDNGAVTSLINCGGLLFGCIAMQVCTLPLWGDAIEATGTISLMVGIITLPAWAWLSRRLRPA